MSQEFAIASESRIAHYQVGKRIGAGGMGEVYKAIDLTLERAVALKILPPSLLGDADRVRRFVQEAKSASALNHPNIVTIYEIGQSSVEPPEGAKESAQTVHYMAMEFIDGQTLRSMIYGGTPLPELLRVLAQAADGLAKAHDAGIVHRDLKPDNIMITSDGYAKVVDFGLAKLTEQKAGGQKGMTQTGMVMGTVGYMSPEQVEGSVILPPSDIFAFGCILYECAARRRPFESDLAIDTLHKIMFSEPMPVSAYLADAHPNLQPLIDRCLRKKPAERISSMRELAGALRELVGYVTGPSVAQGAQATVMLGSGGIGTMIPSAPQSQPLSRPAYQSAGTARPAVELPPPIQPSQPATPYYASSRGISITGILSAAYKLALLVVIGVAAWVWLTMPNVASLKATNPPAPHWTEYGDFSSSLRRAVVAAIDPEYYDRRALDPKKPQELIKALTSADRGRHMPSAITKTIAGQIYPTAGWNPAGPARRWAIAASMEQKLSRRRILEIYLNLAQFGEASGANQAARRYFKKAPSRLTQDEAVLLSASLFTSPFDPANPSSEITAAKANILQQLGRVATETVAPTTTVKDEPAPRTKRKSRKPATTTTAPAPPESTTAPEPIPAPSESTTATTTTP